MTALLFAPHNDDETLFAAFTLIRERPHVIVCLHPYVQEHVHGFGVTAETRIAETRAAMEVLGCDWEQWAYLDRPRLEEWELEMFRAEILALAGRNLYEHVYAPAVEPGGHYHHNLVGELADWAFGPGRVTHYMTYANRRGRSVGSRPVPYSPDWGALKRHALACYESQIALESTGHHFIQPLDEWYQ